jgi:hypothetical protein
VAAAVFKEEEEALEEDIVAEEVKEVQQEEVLAGRQDRQHSNVEREIDYLKK